MQTEFDMRGKVAMVTGASSGFGVYFAQLMAARGAQVVVAARRVERLEHADLVGSDPRQAQAAARRRA